MESKWDGDWVAFRLADVYLPDPREPVSALPSDALLMGRLVGYSDSGSEQEAFGVVAVAAGQRVIVPTKVLHWLLVSERDRPDGPDPDR